MEKQGLNELAAAVHENAVAHGWWEQERELPEILMLCVSELAEALEVCPSRINGHEITRKS